MYACSPHISDHGSADVSVGGTSLSVTALIGSDSNGHFTVSAQQCSIHIGSLDIKFHGGARSVMLLWSLYLLDS